ncbi:hypothetical protein HAX54_048206 [Datura stramonium]|uniref:S-locus glycoprotein domain-containing protein n=1 Tax=Datura stramonium TaxID=4076 RepID=A0ABS8STX8_DATST|nr:hypothetical protein [Datura stramonium]
MGMKLGGKFCNWQEVYLSSWKNEENPAPGDFTYHCDPSGYPQNIVKNGSDVVYSSGPWNGRYFSGTQNSRQDNCDMYKLCGAYGSCNSQDSPVCGCLDKFVPNNSDAWKKTDWSGGCVRRTELNCLQGDEGIQRRARYLHRMAASESDSLEQSEGKKRKVLFWILPLSVGLILVFLSLLIYHRRRKKALELKSKGGSGCGGNYKMNYNSDKLRGGFGPVYKAYLKDRK